MEGNVVGRVRTLSFVYSLSMWVVKDTVGILQSTLTIHFSVRVVVLS